ncbi:uncharacterized protein LOC141666870 [Apium graveolens]|uniref:uncharacterized protein LOC141666870 n=1 Tax=Apium graveolens TaxID=4045 RepID=UPI003D7A9618
MGKSVIDDKEGAEQLQYLIAPLWKRKLDSLGLAELKISQERLEPSIEDAPTLELNPQLDHLSYAFLGAPHDKGLGYIFEDVEGSRTDPPVPTEGSSHVQQEFDRTGVGDGNYRRLTRRLEAMHDIHRHFATDLTRALGTIFRATGVEVDWPPDPSPEEGDPPAN